MLCKAANIYLVLPQLITLADNTWGKNMPMMLAKAQQFLFGEIQASRPQILNSWFDEEPAAKPVETRPVLTIRKSIQSIKRSLQGRVPAMPASAQCSASNFARQIGCSPYRLLNDILSANSPSSQWLDQNELLDRFLDHDCMMDVTMSKDGVVNAVLRANDGYRRTVVCRPDGSSVQRITNQTGEEVARFNSQQQFVRVHLEKRELLLATA